MNETDLRVEASWAVRSDLVVHAGPVADTLRLEIRDVATNTHILVLSSSESEKLREALRAALHWSDGERWCH